MNKKETQKARNIIEELFYDEKAITQWQYELLEMVVNVAQTKVKNNYDLSNVSSSFNHEIISKIRNSQSDAEARRIISNHIKNMMKIGSSI
jgi:hypothetical protein